MSDKNEPNFDLELYQLRDVISDLETFRDKMIEACESVSAPKLPDSIYLLFADGLLPDGVTRQMMLDYYGPDIVELVRMRFSHRISPQTFERLFAAAAIAVKV